MNDNRVHVLVIDDDEDDFVIVRDLLDDLGDDRYQVEWASSSAKAIARLSDGDIDVSLLDYRLGGEDGIEVLRNILTLPNHPAVIMVTGQGNDEVDQLALELGASDYIIKRDMTVRSLDRSIRYAVGQLRALRDLEAREAALRVNKRAIEAAVNGILICDAFQPGIPVIYANPAFERISGYAEGAFIGLGLDALAGEGQQGPELSELHRALSEKREASVVMSCSRRDGSSYWASLYLAPVMGDAGSATHFVVIVSDVTAAKRYEEELAYQANHDALTGLPNRNLLKDRLEQAISFARRHGRLVGVMFIDLDQFKVINDGIGHHVGDAMLMRAAATLRTCLRDGDTVARLGGDEFVIVCADLEAEDDILPVAKRVLDRLAQPVEIEGDLLQTTGSVGIAFYPKDGGGAAILLRNADLAMYKAKDRGRANYQFFTIELNDRISERLQLEKRLREALEREEFELHYQPQVNAVSGQVTGMEALLRWRHPESGLVMPGRFIGIAEETRLIVPIGDWVLREACRQMAYWLEQTGVEVPVSVNVSVAQFHRRDFAEVVRDALRLSGLPAHLLELEITESMVMDNPETFVAMLQSLKALGIRIAIDDFGTGYSNLAYLKRLPVDRLKIDYTFVRDVIADPDDAAICRSIIAVAHNLRLGVVAEGVETEGQAVFLGRHFCDDLQGYHLARPMPAADVPPLLRDGVRLFNPPAVLTASRTLLIVDDEVNIHSSLRRLLRNDGYRILTALSAEEAFNHLAVSDVGVVIVDQRMQGMSGTELLGRVKELYPRTVRIILSGFTDLDTVTGSVNQGAVYKFLLKPWDNEQLRTQLREAFWYYEMSQATADHLG